LKAADIFLPAADLSAVQTPLKRVSSDDNPTSLPE
jgi:hypothetical protein